MQSRPVCDLLLLLGPRPLRLRVSGDQNFSSFSKRLLCTEAVLPTCSSLFFLRYFPDREGRHSACSSAMQLTVQKARRRTYRTASASRGIGSLGSVCIHLSASSPSLRSDAIVPRPSAAPSTQSIRAVLVPDSVAAEQGMLRRLSNIRRPRRQAPRGVSCTFSPTQKTVHDKVHVKNTVGHDLSHLVIAYPMTSSSLRPDSPPSLSVTSRACFSC